MPLNGWTILCCIILADLAYYWEHRFLHSNGYAWAAHTVHHSSQHFNISVAYRHGPMNWFFPLFFHLPLAILGFHPFIIFLAEIIVIEAIFNTPSHHRVHRATNMPYLDKNYASILIIWDRMFGTFAKEQTPVRYGVYPKINSVNPFKVFFCGYIKLFARLWLAPSWRYRYNL